MSANQVIAILAIVIPSGTALLVAYWHRKQMRQLEAFRRDPAVGLSPPPSALWVHFKKYWQLWQSVVGMIAQVASLVSELRSAAPITRGTVVLVSTLVGGFVLNLVMVFILVIFRQIGRGAETQGRIIDTQGSIIDTMGKLAETARLAVERDKLQDRLAVARRAGGDAT